MRKEKIAVVVAHPDDEVLWAGGTLLTHPSWDCFIVSMCRGSDPDRAPKFFSVLQAFGAQGKMGNLDDGPHQTPLEIKFVEENLKKLLPQESYQRIITHSPLGEYSRHRRHEEIGNAVMNLWLKRELLAQELWLFAYQEQGNQKSPKAIKTATFYSRLKPEIWHKKFTIITELYGFSRDSFEAITTPRYEAFWVFNQPTEVLEWKKQFMKI